MFEILTSSKDKVAVCSHVVGIVWLFLSFVSGIAYGLGCSSGSLLSVQDVLRFLRGTTAE